MLALVVLKGSRHRWLSMCRFSRPRRGFYREVLRVRVSSRKSNLVVI